MSEPRRPTLKVCVAGTFDPRFHRNLHVLRLLDLAGLDVDKVQVPLWGMREDQIVRHGKLRVAARAAWALPRVAWRFLCAPRPDVLFVAYPGHFDMLMLAPLAWWRSVPVVFDPFISLFDTVVADRKLAGPRSLLGRALALLDRTACRAADVLLADTPAHAEYLAILTGVSPARFRTLWVGADERLFRPHEVAPEAGRILFYGTFIPLHGIETILAAAEGLEDRPLRFHVIGTGQERARAEALVRDRGLTNVHLADPVPLEELPLEIARSWLCLGIFGRSGKAQRVVPNKVFQCMAVGRPVLTSDGPAIRAAFSSTEIATVPPGEPHRLAEAIRRLEADPEGTEELARAGRGRFDRDYSGPVLSRQLCGHLQQAVERHRERY